jgi:hypothetical protein
MSRLTTSLSSPMTSLAALWRPLELLELELPEPEPPALA